MRKYFNLFLAGMIVICMVLAPCAAFADTVNVPMRLTVSEEPLVFDVTERIQMTATKGETKITIDPVTVTNTGTKNVQVSSIAINPASGWNVETSSTDFETAAESSVSFTCGSHDFASGAYNPVDVVMVGDSKTYNLKGSISAKADSLTEAKVSDLILTIEKSIVVSWTDGTTDEIVAMVAAADAGEINLADYWSVGDTRTVHLSAMEATGVGESHAAQDVELVLMHAGGYELADGSTCNFIVGQKDALAEAGYMNATLTNAGSWESCARRAWCNSVYKEAIPKALQPIFKQFKTVTIEEYGGTTLKTSLDYFALPAPKEVFGGDAAESAGVATGYSNVTEFNALFQFDWYKTESNRIKVLGISGSAGRWWERSPVYSDGDGFCCVDNGYADAYSTKRELGLAPFGCI